MHFDIGEWADFVRGVAKPAHRASMEAHLSSGCRACRSTVDLLRQIVAITAAEAQYQPPASAVRCAKAILALQRPEKMRRLPRLLTRLVYDTFREPLPAGARAQRQITQQALYEAGDFSLDLMVEHERGAAEFSLVGQIAHRKEPTKPVAGVPVFLMASGKTVARTVSNQFGEFHMDCQPQEGLQLHVPVVHDGGRRIEVSLNRLMPKIPRGLKAGKPRKVAKRARKSVTRER